MRFTKPSGKTKLEKLFLKSVEHDTPNKVKNNPLIYLNNKNKFEFILKREHLKRFKDKNDGLGLLDWFDVYKEEAKISTAGIRGLQNPLYPWDTRYPINLVGMMLATLGKIKVAQKSVSNKTKIAACEVRYNSPEYVELISRIQASCNIKTLVTNNYETIPIFLISFIVFMYDLYGGEYVTSSHAMCKKTATKDLNKQGSQYIPEESLKFVKEVEKILKEVNKNGSYKINFSNYDNNLIDRSFLKSINNGINLYTKYLKNAVATKKNLNIIKNSNKKIIIDCMGGCMYETLSKILKNLNIYNKYNFLHKKEDPFNHGIGKVINKKGKLFDWGCDTTIMRVNLKTMDIKIPVLETIDYTNYLKKYPVGTVMLITDPDADRLITTYIEKFKNLKKIKELGLVYIQLDSERILVMFTPNQSFLMNLDFQMLNLKRSGLWKKYDWFILKTTASQKSWDEWAKNNDVPVINTPVGFKELADTMQFIEKKLENNNGSTIKIRDVFGNNVSIGKKPRMLFAGEESGGEIFGPTEMISSKSGRKAISMREKSAGEAIIIASAMAGWLEKRDISPADYLKEVFEKNNIVSRYEIRLDEKYYNESEPDINKLLKEKEKGMIVKKANDTYFLSLALGLRDNIITLENVKDILGECFPKLLFNDIIDIKFVGDGTFMKFKNKCLEVRPSGTDAINKAYCYGNNQWECIKYAKELSSYSGKRNNLHKKYISEKFYNNVKDYSFELYSRYKKNQ